MSSKAMSAACLVLTIMILASTGCVTSQGPYMGIFSFPIPVSPYYQDKEEDEAWVHERYGRVPVLPSQRFQSTLASVSFGLMV